jgi:hypothetical protein
MVSVAVYVEGPTEWQVARKLSQKRILSGGDFIHIDWPSPGKMKIGEVGSSLKELVNQDNNGKTGILINPPSDRILLMFDQEKMNSPSDAKDKLERHIQRFNHAFEFHQHNEFSNVFIGELSTQENSILIAIHVADNSFGLSDGNKDFDGYILELLKNETGHSIIQNILTNDLRISALRTKVEHNPRITQIVHQLGEQDIPSLMNEKDWSVMRSKTILYSYITALQLGISHVWFCKNVVEKADEDKLRLVFASLIAAWDELCKGG